MQTGDYFMVDYKGNDKSWRSNTFRCTASDDRVVVGLICGKESNIFTDPLSFNRAEWEFFPASLDVVDAQCFDPVEKIKGLEYKLIETEHDRLIYEHRVRSLEYDRSRLTRTTDLSIITMYIALVAAGMSLSLLVFTL